MRRRAKPDNVTALTITVGMLRRAIDRRDRLNAEIDAIIWAACGASEMTGGGDPEEGTNGTEADDELRKLARSEGWR